MNTAEKLESAEAEVARLENITKIQQKQIERLMEERDVLHPFRTELDAVARATLKHDEEYTPGAYYEEEKEKNSELNQAVRKALDALKAKGWKSSD